MRRIAVAAAALALLAAFPPPAAAQAPVTEVAFSPGSGGGTTSAMKELLLTFLEAAAASVDLAGYTIADDDVISALNTLHGRGVTVRVVTDLSRDNGDLSGLSGGIPVVDESPSDPDEMHHKFVVVDGAAVWTGSANFTVTNFTRKNNNAVIVRNAEIAAAYTAEFERMFVDRDFKEGKSGVLADSVTTGGQTIECRFAPTDGVAERIMQILSGAASSIYFAAFTYNHNEIADEMIARYGTGVAVGGVFDRDQSDNDAFTQFDELDAAIDGGDGASSGGILRMVSDAGDDMHHKFIVVDRSIVVTGSFNFTDAANERNDENIVVIEDAAVADRYIQELNRISGKDFENLGENDPDVTTVAGAGEDSGTTDDGASDAGTSAASTPPRAISMPNPFTPGRAALVFSTVQDTTTLRVAGSGPAIRWVRIFTLDGRRIRTLDGGGRGYISWDGRNDAGDLLASGVYLYEIETDRGTFRSRLTLVR